MYGYREAFCRKKVPLQKCVGIFIGPSFVFLLTIVLYPIFEISLLFLRWYWVGFSANMILGERYFSTRWGNCVLGVAFEGSRDVYLPDIAGRLYEIASMLLLKKWLGNVF